MPCFLTAKGMQWDSGQRTERDARREGVLLTFHQVRERLDSHIRPAMEPFGTRGSRRGAPQRLIPEAKSLPGTDFGGPTLCRDSWEGAEPRASEVEMREENREDRRARALTSLDNSM